MLVNVFLGSIATGTAFEQLDAFLHQSPTQYGFHLKHVTCGFENQIEVAYHISTSSMPAPLETILLHICLHQP